MQPLQQISENQWQYIGKHATTLITYERVGLFHRYTVPGTDTTFGTEYAAAEWLAKQDNQATGSSHHATV